jgi:hypothetical protein
MKERNFDTCKGTYERAGEFGNKRRKEFYMILTYGAEPLLRSC